MISFFSDKIAYLKKNKQHFFLWIDTDCVSRIIETQAGSDLRTSLVQIPVQRRGSSQVRPGYSGLYPAEWWKASGMEITVLSALASWIIVRLWRKAFFPDQFPVTGWIERIQWAMPEARSYSLCFRVSNLAPKESQRHYLTNLKYIQWKMYRK